MFDPRNDPVNLFMEKWRQGPAKSAVLNMTGTQHIPESTYKDAMSYRQSEQHEYTRAKELAVSQAADIDNAKDWLGRLTKALKDEKAINSKLNYQNDEFRKQLATLSINQRRISGTVGDVKDADTSGSRDGGVVGDDGGRPDSTSDERGSGEVPGRGPADGEQPAGSEGSGEGKGD